MTREFSIRWFVCALVAVLAFAGCGRGWARIEPLASLSPTDTRVFDRTEAWFSGPVSRAHPVRSMVLSGRSRQESPSGEVIRTWLLLAHVAPSDVPGRVRITAAVGRRDYDRKPVWRYYASDANVELWRYARHTMLYGQMQPAERDGDPMQQMFSACLNASPNPGRFRKIARQLRTELGTIRATGGSSAAGDADDVLSLDEAIRSLDRALGNSAGKSKRK